MLFYSQFRVEPSVYLAITQLPARRRKIRTDLEGSVWRLDPAEPGQEAAHGEGGQPQAAARLTELA